MADNPFGQHVAKSPITEKRRRFVEEYLIDLNATRAATVAGYSAKTAQSQGKALLTMPVVKALIDAAIAERSERTKITQDAVLLELHTLMNSDVRHFTVSESGKLELAPNAPESAWRSVSSVKHRRIVSGRDEDKEITYEVEYRLWDKPAAIRMAGQHLGMFKDRDPVLSPLDVARAVREAVRAMNATDGLDAAA
jgi:phage terminase small subunit